MKFAKQLETESEDIPREWRPYLIRYKALKKMIGKVTEEIEKRGLSATLLHDCVYNNHLKYHFTVLGEPPHVKPNIEIFYDSERPEVQEILSRLVQPGLEYQRSYDNKDVFSLTKAERNQSEAMMDVVKELLNMSLDQNNRQKSIVIELEKDDEFFKLLIKELTDATTLQEKTAEQFKKDVHVLESKMTRVTSPTQKRSDIYHWRKIFSIYMDACIFTGSDSIDRSKAQMQWFLTQLEQSRMLGRLKNKESRLAFEQFVTLNTELITIQHYQLLNQTAIRKILKKHDKQSGLSASQAFNQLSVAHQPLNPRLAKTMYAIMTEKMSSIVPQPDDYACPVCMCVAWRPIRLVCDHVFCVRCLIKAQKKKMTRCPMCRHPTAVGDATAANLDESLQNFLKLYFPREIKDKKRDNEREQAIEDVQAMTGKRYTEEQLLKMSQSSNCCIM
ncbi:SPX domain-containing protein [Sporodiniella umbellata]|nr:SPX domain-containing protein [Sporodiniella umbellata]